MTYFAMSFHPFVIDQEKLSDSDMVKYYASKLSENFHAFRSRELIEIAEYMAIYAWSPIVFFDGRRKESNFGSCNLLALDFDKGKKVGDALAEFEEYQYIVGTTKSHTEERHKFRVLIPFEDEFTSAFDYRYVMKYLTVKYGADRACIDAARFYFPCKKIVAWQKTGKYMSPAVPKKYQEPIENYNYSHDRKYMPSHIKRFLTIGEPFGAGRNQSCFVTAKHLRNAGYTDGEVLSQIKQGAGPRIIGPDFSESELETAVKHGLKKVNQY